MYTEEETVFMKPAADSIKAFDKIMFYNSFHQTTINLIFKSHNAKIAEDYISIIMAEEPLGKVGNFFRFQLFKV